jgi:hypothetical protein
MAFIHRTTMSPTKDELLAAWLPGRPWYVAGAGAPELTRAGGFRLDDPEGEVGMEFMVVTDTSGGRPLSYHIPLTYRGAPLEGAEQALIGTSEHGVLGLRWVYDGAHDPVLVAQLLALLQGGAEPQAQNESDTPDPTVVPHFTGPGLPAGAVPATVADGADGTAVTLRITAAPKQVAGQTSDQAVGQNPDQAVGQTPDQAVGQTPEEDRGGSEASVEAPATATLRVVRVLHPEGQGSGPRTAGALARLTAGWRPRDGEEHRGTFAVLDGARSH